MANAKKKKLTRRTFLAIGLGVATIGGVFGPLFQFSRIVLAFLYPRKEKENWAFVAPVGGLPQGQTMGYVAPDGQSVAISRVGPLARATDFVALSSVCPHLGCKVHWERGTKTFFCPCHNGRFDSLGQPLEGPPAKDGQALISFPLKVEKGLLYIRVSPESLLRVSRLSQSHKGCS